jgi:predicted nucleic acid-binding protein
MRRTQGSIVLDTDVASFLVNRDPVRGPRYSKHLVDQTVVLPFAVVAEMLFGAEDRGWGFQRRLKLEQFIRTHLIDYPNFASARHGRKSAVRPGSWAGPLSPRTRGSPLRRCISIFRC